MHRQSWICVVPQCPCDMCFAMRPSLLQQPIESHSHLLVSLLNPNYNAGNELTQIFLPFPLSETSGKMGVVPSKFFGDFHPLDFLDVKYEMDVVGVNVLSKCLQCRQYYGISTAVEALLAIHLAITFALRQAPFLQDAISNGFVLRCIQCRQ